VGYRIKIVQFEVQWRAFVDKLMNIHISHKPRLFDDCFYWQRQRQAEQDLKPVSYEYSTWIPDSGKRIRNFYRETSWKDDMCRRYESGNTGEVDTIQLAR
jgi:hypothetical protein